MSDTPEQRAKAAVDLINNRLESMKSGSRLVAQVIEAKDGVVYIDFSVAIRSFVDAAAVDADEDLTRESMAANTCASLSHEAHALSRILMMLVEHKDAKAFKL